MGNRTGSPPEQYRDDEEDEQPESEPETDGTQQTVIPQPETDDRDTPKDDSDAAGDHEESRDSDGVGGGSGGGFEMPTGSEPDDQPPENKSNERNGDEAHPDKEEEIEPECNEQDDSKDDKFEFVYGDIVHDREEKTSENEEQEDVVVVNLPDDPIADWNCGSDGETLADRNTGYPLTDSVVVVTLDILNEKMPKWDKRHSEIPLETFDDNGIEYRCYPSLRLELEEPSHLRTL